MFWSLLIFHGHSTREPASVVCNDEQGDLLYCAGQHRNLRYLQLTQEKMGTVFRKRNEGEWTGKIEFRKEEIPGARRGMRGYFLSYSGL